jgi:hypothetical protein
MMGGQGMMGSNMGSGMQATDPITDTATYGNWDHRMMDSPIGGMMNGMMGRHMGYGPMGGTPGAGVTIYGCPGMW